MKKEGHPDYHFIEVVMTDGTKYKTRSTMGKEGHVLSLDIDPRTHPAWTGGNATMLDRGGRLSRFKDKFKGFVKAKAFVRRTIYRTLGGPAGDGGPSAFRVQPASLRTISSATPASASAATDAGHRLARPRVGHTVAPITAPVTSPSHSSR